MNLVMGIVWLAGAVALFVYEYRTGDRRSHIRGTDLSAGWLLLVLAAYNLVRWYSARSYRAEQRALFEAQAARMRQIRDRDRPPPDPNLDFTNEAPSPSPPPSEQPPTSPGSRRKSAGRSPRPRTPGR